jgi:uroporphyrinogen decarboxylase
MNNRILQSVFSHQAQERIPRGELWLGKQLFQGSSLADNLSGHIQLRKQLGMDLLFLPLSGQNTPSQNMEYRWFSLAEVKRAVEISGLFVGVIIDGPFQRMVARHGLIDVLTGLKRNESEIAGELKKETEDVEALVACCMELTIGAVVIADDIAYQHSTYINPQDMVKLFNPIYTNLVSHVKAGGAYALFHSCGDISGFLDQLVACGFDGLAACQGECLDLVSIQEKYCSLILLAGIDADLLESESLDEMQKRDFRDRVVSLAKGGGFILASSCGLYSPSSCQRLMKLYEMVDESVSRF